MDSLYMTHTASVLQVINTNMNQLFGRMRELSIRDLKQRREEIFERTRRMMEADGEEDVEESCEIQETQNEGPKESEMMQEESSNASNFSRRKKKQEQNNRIRRYWRKMLQVTDYMLEVPDNLRDFYVAARPDGNRCVMIIRNYKLQLRDKNGSEVFSCDVKGKNYDKCIFEVYYNKEQQYIVISDLIVWKENPMTSSEFQFRYAWLISNVILANLRPAAKISIFTLKFYPCNLQGIKQAYTCFFQYQKQGLVFVHKDSFYLHGLNPNVLVWKDAQISKYILAEIEENMNGCKAVGFLNKQGQIKCKENVTLFAIDRKTIDPFHRYVKFSYKNMIIDNLEEDGVKVHLQDLKILQTMKNYYGVTDSLGKLLYKCRVGTSMVTIQEIANRCASIMQE